MIIAIGGLLALAALRGGARWLIAPAVALAVGGGVCIQPPTSTSAAESATVSYQPVSAKAIPADGYQAWASV